MMASLSPRIRPKVCEEGYTRSDIITGVAYPYSKTAHLQDLHHLIRDSGDPDHCREEPHEAADHAPEWIVSVTPSSKGHDRGVCSHDRDSDKFPLEPVLIG